MLWLHEAWLKGHNKCSISFVEFNLLTFAQQYFHICWFFSPLEKKQKPSFWHWLLDSVYSPRLLAVLVLLYDTGLCSSFVHISSQSFPHAVLRPKVGSLRQAHPSAAHRRTRSYKSTFRWRESLDVSIIDTDFFTTSMRATEDCECSTHRKRSLESVRRKRWHLRCSLVISRLTR